ncbi:MAG TPA: NAD-dependent epimerase/dehydratase family protein [Candidatus Marinimicrobia bacterium]|jgi:UDP-glucose 4-epimerase|nr:NAD-dependent epimerase/dehydratase family protein [Candidatus Neomarinimicrobiota bacterium]HHZ98797.1 NAD-dependent epimerase/dehydratase family protein [Candidatus Neomarinimicrobiota bacterium]HIB02825.1 NAD-dependent epimerase/dehydratase family protein [Candidatus Neomarinimicrobiota bacterium]HIB70638.1 NAD-dependent epimerase/dehydratase family protein [Candidatus Neomarinimicrobiota bacterium]HIB96561.1 NAD-dependent epimerase/dehydratase family protein [Candidatus Neomarinimicrobio
MGILITGSSGYIGTELCRRLQADRSIGEIIGIDVLPPRETFEKLIFYERDCCNDLADIFQRQKIETVVHLVFVLNPMHDSKKMYRINVGTLENVLDNVKKFGIQRLVVTSSGTAYGAYPDNPERITEDMPIRGHTYQYANDKKIVEEKLAEFEKENSGVDIVIARPAVVCGAHIGNLISRYVSKPWVPLVKGSTARVQLLHEKDAADALFALVKEAKAGAYNLGPEETLTQDELVSITGGIQLRLGPRIIRMFSGLGWALRLKFLSEAPSSMLDFVEFSWVVDGSKIERETSFRYKHSSKDSLRDFVAATKQ